MSGFHPVLVHCFRPAGVSTVLSALRFSTLSQRHTVGNYLSPLLSWPLGRSRATITSHRERRVLARVARARAPVRGSAAFGRNIRTPSSPATVAARAGKMPQFEGGAITKATQVARRTHCAQVGDKGAQTS